MSDIVRERRNDMRQIGTDAKLIGELMKSGNLTAVAEPAGRMAKIAYEMGSKYLMASPGAETNVADSVFEDPARFNYSVQAFGDAAGAAQQAALSGGDVALAVQDLFKQCANCHEAFIKPTK